MPTFDNALLCLETSVIGSIPPLCYDYRAKFPLEIVSRLWIITTATTKYRQSSRVSIKIIITTNARYSNISSFSIRMDLSMNYNSYTQSL